MARRGPVRLVGLAVWLAAAVASAPGGASGQPGARPAPRANPASTFDSLSGRRATVFHTPRDSLLARALLSRLEGQRPLPGLPDTVPSGVRAWLAPDRRTFDSLAGGRLPEWTGGVAIPAADLLVVPTFGGALTASGEAARVLRHEWAHLGLHQYLGGLRVPRWFSEGYAEWAGGWDAAGAWRLRVLLATGQAPPLDSLSLGWPGDRASAEAAYLLSATAVQYLMEASGERGLAIFLRRWRARGSFEESLRATYGVTSGQMEEDWRAWVRRRYGWLYVFSHSMVVWLFLALALLVLVRIRARRDRARLERLRRQEPPDRPAYWLGEEVPRTDDPEESPPESPPGTLPPPP